MRKKDLIILVCFGLIPLVGCGIEPGISGKARMEYLETIKPYLEYWGKADMTVDSRRIDSWECGAASTVHAAEHVVFSSATINAEKKPGEDRNKPAIIRLRMKWVECMKDQGYVWVKAD